MAARLEVKKKKEQNLLARITIEVSRINRNLFDRSLFNFYRRNDFTNKHGIGLFQFRNELGNRQDVGEISVVGNAGLCKGFRARARWS